jgi:hypothetical protein
MIAMMRPFEQWESSNHKFGSLQGSWNSLKRREILVAEG